MIKPGGWEHFSLALRYNGLGLGFATPPADEISVGKPTGEMV